LDGRDLLVKVVLWTFASAALLKLFTRVRDIARKPDQSDATAK
jgi:hypothetical protein